MKTVSELQKWGGFEGVLLFSLDQSENFSRGVSYDGGESGRFYKPIFIKNCLKANMVQIQYTYS